MRLMLEDWEQGEPFFSFLKPFLFLATPQTPLAALLLPMPCLAPPMQPFRTTTLNVRRNLVPIVRHLSRVHRLITPDFSVYVFLLRTESSTSVH